MRQVLRVVLFLFLIVTITGCKQSGMNLGQVILSATPDQQSAMTSVAQEQNITIDPSMSLDEFLSSPDGLNPEVQALVTEITQSTLSTTNPTVLVHNPEPASLSLLGIGLFALLRKRKKEVKKGILVIVSGIFMFMFAGIANASLVDRLIYTAPGAGISIDAIGLNDNQVGTLSAEIPAGATIFRSYLYSADVMWGSGLQNVNFGGTALTSAVSSKLDVGTRNANPDVNENIWDVTSIVQSVVGTGSGTFNFNVTELGYLDGEILSVIYAVPSQPVNTVFLFDGESAPTGDNFDIILSTPVDKTNPNFDALLSLGISFGYQGSGQYSIVNVNGSRLTTSAGGQDDGFGSDGGLITAGGIGDSTTNPSPYALASGPRSDDELYSLKDFVTNGDTVIHFTTQNPSQDDNLFFASFTTLGVARLGGDNVVPEPASMVLMGIGLVGAALRRRKR